ncbi:MAG: hypothetical protein K6T30_02150 [Alicyclobacillus sp.]|nr:hypothetical protein [Alicyclobacillus sp.]
MIPRLIAMWGAGTLALMALAGTVGYEAGVGQEAKAVLTQVRQIETAMGTGSGAVGQGPTWMGLSQAGASLEQALRGARVQTADGKQVPFPTDKPVIVMAPWCKYCHMTLQLLQREGLLPRVTVVAAGLEFSESGKQANSRVTLAEAKQEVQKSFDHIGVKLSAKNVLYALPGTAVDKVITGYPDVFVPHGGRLYVQPGYVADERFWQMLLG